MPALKEPFEIFDIGDGETVEITVIDVVRGDEVEMTREDGTKFRIAPLRLYLEKPIWEGRFAYIDITSKRLRPTLEPLLGGIPPGKKRLRITKRGVAPRAVFSVETLPL